MLKPLRMTRLVIGGHKDHLEPLLDLLQNEGVVQLEDYLDPTGQTEIGTPLEEGDFASEQLLRARGLLKSLDAESIAPKALATEEPDRILDDAETEVLPVLDALSEARAELAAAEAEAQVLEPFEDMDMDLSVAAGRLEHVQVWIGTTRQDPRPAMRRLTDVETDVRQVGKQWGLVIAARRSDADAVEAALSGLGFSAANLQPREGTPGERLQELREETVALRGHVADLEGQVAELRHEWGLRLSSLESHLANEVDKTQAPLRFAVTDTTFHAEGWLPRKEANHLAGKMRAQFKDHLYVDLLGDAPRRRADGATQAHVAGHDDLGEGHGDDHGSDPSDEAPTALDNKGLAKPFEFLLGLLGRPRYHELDPTKLMLIFFPLFFGLMVGDVLVGLVIVLIGWYLKTHYIFGIGGGAVGRLLVMGGVMSIVIGAFVFGEALGIHFVVDDHALEEGERSWEEIIYGKEAVLHGDAGFPTEGFIHKTGGHGEAALDLHQANDQGDGVPPPPGEGDAHADEHHGGLLAPHSDTHLSMAGVVNLGYYSKVHDVQALLIWSIIIGVVHIVLGLLLGIRNVYVSHGAKLAVQEKVSWLLIMASIGVIGWAYTAHASNTIMYGAAAVFVVALGLLWAGVAHTIGVGFIAILEVPSLFGNILSYTRLAAIGASKAGMAIAFATIGFDMVGGIGGWIIYLASFALITVLAILAGSLQSLRLQFVEFFSKFYEGGGRPYLPFGRRGA